MKDNSILIEFNFLIDLDLALFKLIKEKYNNPNYVDQKLIRLNNEKEIIKILLNRQSINPLELLIPNIDTLELYKELMGNEIELLKYAKACDIFGLMITFLKEASSVDITVLCKTRIEQNFIKSLNPNLKTIIKSNRRNVNLQEYTIIYTKYYANIIEYNNVVGKHIYIANAKYNMEQNKDIPNIGISAMVADVNIIHLIDLYQDIKYERKIENDLF